MFFLGNATHIDLDIIVDSIGEINSLRKVVCLNNVHLLNILDETIVRNQDFISKWFLIADYLRYSKITEELNDPLLEHTLTILCGIILLHIQIIIFQTEEEFRNFQHYFKTTSDLDELHYKFGLQHFYSLFLY